MRNILDKMFGNRKLSMIIPMLAAFVAYLLFVIFGKAEDKTNIVIMTPILSVFWFFGVFLVVYIQIKNTMCPDWFLNLFELLATVLFGLYAIIGIISFVIRSFQDFDYGLCLGFVTYSALSWAHSKRTK